MTRGSSYSLARRQLSVPTIEFLPPPPPTPERIRPSLKEPYLDKGTDEEKLVEDICAHYQLDQNSREELDNFRNLDKQAKELYLVGLMLSLKMKGGRRSAANSEVQKTWLMPTNLNLSIALRQKLLRGKIKKFKLKLSENIVIERALLELGGRAEDGRDALGSNDRFACTLKDARKIFNGIRADIKRTVKKSVGENEFAEQLAEILADGANIYANKKLIDLATVLKKVFISDGNRSFWDKVDADLYERDRNIEVVEPNRRKKRKRSVSESLIDNIEKEQCRDKHEMRLGKRSKQSQS